MESLRYRVEDMHYKINKTAIQRARLADINRELLNSEVIKSAFVQAPGVLDKLSHTLSFTKKQEQLSHLKTLPEYIIPVPPEQTEEEPEPMVNTQKKKKRKRQRQVGSIAATH